MESELKQEMPNLVVGDAPAAEDAPSIEITDIPKDAALPATVGNVKKENDPSSNTAAPSSTDGAAQSASEEDAPFVISVVDILAALYIALACVGVAIVSTINLNTSESAVFSVHVVQGFIVFFNVLFGSFWLSDIVSKIHAARGEKGFLTKFDKFACIHPSLYMLVLMIPTYIAQSFGDTSSSVTASMIASLMTMSFGLPFLTRWLFWACGLAFHCSNLTKGSKQKNKTSLTILGLVSGISLFAPLLAFLGPGFLVFSFVVSAISFVCLRNAVLKASPDVVPTYVSAPAPPPHDPDAVVLPYNHFVELQKWFKKRFALRSLWKTSLLIVILIAAVAGHLHEVVLHFIENMVVTLLPHISGAHAPVGYSGHGPRITTPNAAANALLVLSIAGGMLAATLVGLLAFIKAPKKLAIGKEGVGFRYLNVPGNQDDFVSWADVKHIRIERPKGKTSAASDRLVLERAALPPFRIKLAGIAAADDRERILAAIDRFAPEISREAIVEETLRKPMEHNYTELWLQALAAPPKREKFKPLISGVKLDQDRYVVERELGAGGQGFAYLATDTRTDKKVVLKEFVLPVFVDINARRQALEHFEQEAKLMTRLDHKQVVKLDDFFVEDHRAYLVLEHIDGENLRQIVLRDGPMSEERIKSLAEQMCSILSYLHGLSPPLVHRDFTPDNLILHKDGTLKLIDFNVAQQVEYATTGTVVGKQAYLPPEQFRGQAVPASDLYALGATLYFLAAGKDPTPISVARPLKDGVKVSEQLDGLISALTQMEALSRPTTATEVATILKAIPHDQPGREKVVEGA